MEPEDINVDTLMLKNILMSKLQYTKFYNVTTRRMNDLSNAYNKIKKEQANTNQSFLSLLISFATKEDGHDKIIINLKYRIFGPKNIITRLTERLDRAFKEIILYQPQEIMNLLYHRKTNISYDNWLIKINNKIKQRKYKHIKHDNCIVILSYYYNLFHLMEKNKDHSPSSIYKNILDIKSNGHYLTFLPDIYPTYYTFHNDYSILLKVSKALSDNKATIPNMDSVVKESKHKKVLALKSIDRYVNSKDRTDANSVLRYRLWYTHFGKNKYGKCFCCDKRIEDDDPAWHCGHILSDARGGSKDLANTKPICVKCNLSMREQHMFQYMIYNNMIGCKYLSNSDKRVIKYTKMKQLYMQSIPMIKKIEDEKLLPKTIVAWWKKEIQTDSYHMLRASIAYLKIKSKST